MKAQILDPNKLVYGAIRSIGYNVNQIDVEIILNINKYISETKLSISIQDIMMIEDLVRGLFGGPSKLLK
jgi:hypothetical protein